MDVLRTIERLYNIHKLILLEKTGTPDEFAYKIHLSRRQLYNILDELKDWGAEIKYSRIGHTFYYVNDFDVKINQLQISSRDKKDTLL
jgi:predicted DNA-binding transcriptional regulator YafY